jgi:hypothetical protein
MQSHSRIVSCLFTLLNGKVFVQEKKMRYSLPAVLVSVIIVWSVGTVSGKTWQGVNVPEQTLVQASPLTLNGVGLRQATMLKVQGTIAGDDFAGAFLAICLGPQPPNSGLKAGLLSGTCR